MTPPPPSAGCLVDPERRLTFTFEGRSIPALGGQSIAAALYAAGIRIFSRSFKYHRPRGLFCVAGDCANCLMQVNGRPNVRTCIEPVKGGEDVRHQNAWPGLGFDVLRVFDRLSRLLPVGFYYRRFHRPRWLWPFWERVLRRVAGLGRISLTTPPRSDAEVEYLHAEVCVVGGGPAGLAAAAEAARAGADVLLLEAGPRVGGHLLYDTSDPETPALRASLAQPPAGVRVLCNAPVFGVYEGGLLGAVQDNRLLQVRARQVLLCTGGRQHPFLFAHNDLPGIFLGRGVQRLALLHGVRAGQRAVVMTDNDAGHQLAEQLPRLGIEVVAVIDRRPDAAASPLVQPGSTVVAARGGKHLTAVQVARVAASGQVDEGSLRDIACDLLCLVPQLQPAHELARQGGLRYRCDGGRWVVEQGVPGLSAAGAVAGTGGLRAHVAEGRLRGAEAAAALGRAVPGLDALRLADAEARRVPTGPALAPLVRDPGRKAFVCPCEDVTEADVHQAVAEGFDHVETLKRYSTAGMGPCQGKTCGYAVTEQCARATGRDAGSVGGTTSRPPVHPVELSLLAAGQHRPVRRTPLHQVHQNAGARWMDAGQWKRPESYGDPRAEVRGVRTAAGLIDVSTLGKLEVVGPQAAEFLERVYINKVADLQPGRARYGVLCNEDGVLFDDGIVARVAPDRFYLTATTGNAEAVYQWLEMWRATWRLNVAVLSHTSGLAALNLAGPRSRELLARLAAFDVSPGGFPYLGYREGEIAGVRCRVLRIGFVGELGYEIHCPTALAWYLWRALTEAGLFVGVRPFGVEAQRILRLEKGHLLFGHDTDALSTPLEAGLAGLVKWDKPFFLGREPLRRLQERGPRARLVGFHADDRTRVPAEGCQVVAQGRPVGRVTSARYSPTLERSLGLAWVPPEQAAPGSRFTIRADGADLAATVVALPFYDPEGHRLKG